ncbi:uncharacterized protein Dwil_GK20885 [Drosophila willistoni]|uniref:Serpin domain-containing protein n=2 Tax=Drosophila willistoni TaxID=7260 RepID=B4MJS4_DROWI|nr:serine protease inhibitor 42Dd isoform X2 [Drosophila willistoni]EDW72363.1 uncharacterized protein Dwil_GK20885 [Drosophila willistoni]
MSQSQSHDSRNSFSRNLYDVVARHAVGSCQSQGVNMVISPASIQSCFTLAFMGAAGSTADELRRGLNLGLGDKYNIARAFGEFWTTNCNYGEKGPILKSLNSLYVNNTLSLQPEFNDLAKDFFRAKAESVNFADALAVIKQINLWVEQQTDGKIKDLLQPDVVNMETSAILINALYFKGKWLKPFTPETTLRDDFYVDLGQRVDVDMMYQEDKFKYVELPELKARAVQLPYENSDISMLIILPNDISGLSSLEKMLKTVHLPDIEQRMSMEDVEIAMPKFTIEFDLDLKDILKKLGILEIFGNKANLSLLFATKKPQRISAAKHRGYIAVNEAGSEAAAVTFMKIVPMMLNMNKKSFKVDHPFVFYIRNNQAVFFAGRYVMPGEHRVSAIIKEECGGAANDSLHASNNTLYSKATKSVKSAK